MSRAKLSPVPRRSLGGAWGRRLCPCPRLVPREFFGWGLGTRLSAQSHGTLGQNGAETWRGRLNTINCIDSRKSRLLRTRAFMYSPLQEIAQYLMQTDLQSCPLAQTGWIVGYDQACFTNKTSNSICSHLLPIMRI